MFFKGIGLNDRMEEWTVGMIKLHCLQQAITISLQPFNVIRYHKLGCNNLTSHLKIAIKHNVMSVM